MLDKEKFLEAPKKFAKEFPSVNCKTLFNVDLIWYCQELKEHKDDFFRRQALLKQYENYQQTYEFELCLPDLQEKFDEVTREDVLELRWGKIIDDE